MNATVAVHGDLGRFNKPAYLRRALALLPELEREKTMREDPRYTALKQLIDDGKRVIEDQYSQAGEIMPPIHPTSEEAIGQNIASEDADMTDAQAEATDKTSVADEEIQGDDSIVEFEDAVQSLDAMTIKSPAVTQHEPKLPPSLDIFTPPPSEAAGPTSSRILNVLKGSGLAPDTPEASSEAAGSSSSSSSSNKTMT